MGESYDLNRRQFVKVTVATIVTFITAAVGLPTLAYIIYPATQTQESDAWIPLGPLANYPVGQPTLFNFTRTKVNGWEKTVNSYGVYVTRPSDGDIYVLSNVCTHLSCRVTWQDVEADYLCPCHDGIFDIQGTVVSGPPPKPLYRYETKIEDGTLFIHLQEG